LIEFSGQVLFDHHSFICFTYFTQRLASSSLSLSAISSKSAFFILPFENCCPMRVIKGLNGIGGNFHVLFLESLGPATASGYLATARRGIYARLKKIQITFLEYG
jgi:hypothetical protein